MEINQCVRCTDNSSLSHFSAMAWPHWLCRAARNRRRQAIEQASRRWRGGRRCDSARTRRKILISTQVAAERARDSLAEAAAAVDVLYQQEAARIDRRPRRREGSYAAAPAPAAPAPSDAALPPPPPRRAPPPPPTRASTRARGRHGTPRPPPPPASRPRSHRVAAPLKLGAWNKTTRTEPMPFKHNYTVPGSDVAS